MGLTISALIPTSARWHGSYSYFGKFREFLAEVSGVNLQGMNGYGGSVPWTGEESFYELLDHPDNEGEIWGVEELLEDFNNEAHHKEFIRLVEEAELTQYLHAWAKFKELLEVAVEEGGMLHFG